VINGVIIPEDLSSHAAASFILTQQAGKLKPADLRKAIEKHKDEKRKQSKELEEERSQSGPSEAENGAKSYEQKGHEFDYSQKADCDTAFHGTNTQMKEMIFLKGVSEYTQVNTHTRCFRCFRCFPLLLSSSPLTLRHV
jgi:hypothetical protein